jgi:hypothetical protein
MRMDQYDCRTGGSYRYLMTSNGNEFGFHGSYHEVRPSEFIDQTFTFEGEPDTVALEKLVFEDLGDGTRLTSTSLVDSFEGRDAFVASGMEDGVREGHGRLDVLLADHRSNPPTSGHTACAQECPSGQRRARPRGSRSVTSRQHSPEQVQRDSRLSLSPHQAPCQSLDATWATAEAGAHRADVEPSSSGPNVAKLLDSRHEGTCILWTASGLSMRAPDSRARSSSIWLQTLATTSSRELLRCVAAVLPILLNLRPDNRSLGTQGRRAAAPTDAPSCHPPGRLSRRNATLGACTLLPIGSIIDVTDQ